MPIPTPSRPITDHRGVRRRLCALSADELRRAAAPHYPIFAAGEARRRHLAHIILPLLAAAAVLYFVWILRRAPTPLLIIPGFMLLIPLLFYPLQFLPFPAAIRHHNHIRDSLLSANLCASCGYRLTATAPDPADGLTVCPECGSAWRLQTARLPTPR